VDSFFYSAIRSLPQQIRCFPNLLLYFAGQYTIGVFRISLVEPEEVEPTVFQLKVTTAD
jgi:hypothetical protein